MDKHAFWAGVAGGFAINLVLMGIVLTHLDGQGTIAFLKEGSRQMQQAPIEQLSVVSQESRVVDVVEAVNPAVVSIVLTRDVPVVERFFERQKDPRGQAFEDFFGFNPFGDVAIPRTRQNGTQKQEVGGGSGFFISTDGYVVTNAHVVNQSNVEYTVFTRTGESYPAEVIAVDERLDIALIKIEGEGFEALTFGDSDALKLGQSVIAIGNALAEFRNTVSVGVVSGLSRSIVAGDGRGHAESLEGLIQTDAAINPGNSGGPLLNLNGQVIGVNVAVAGGSENIGFSLASNTVKTAVESMKENGRVIRPYLGVRFTPVNEALKEANNLPYAYGALIVRGESREQVAIIPGSPADKANLEEYDLILQVDTVRIDEQNSLPSLIAKKQIGDTITLRVWHEGEERDVRVTLEEQPVQ